MLWVAVPGHHGFNNLQTFQKPVSFDSASTPVRASTTSRDVFWYSTRSRTAVLMPLSSPAASRRKMAASILMRPVNQWVVVRDSLEEPNLSTTNSRRFRLTPHLAELAGNSQMLPERGSLGTRRACLSASPKALSRPFRARVSQSPVRVRVWLTGGSALESPWRFFDREPAGEGEFLKCERQVHWEEQISVKIYLTIPTPKYYYCRVTGRRRCDSSLDRFNHRLKDEPRRLLWI